MEAALVIMAAGMGSRYGGLKQMDSLGPNGEMLIEYALFDAARAGFTKVVFVIRRDFEEAFKEKISDLIPSTLRTYYAYQELDALPPGFTVPDGREKPWGTAQAVLTAKPFISEPFAVQNADDFYGAEAYQTLCTALQSLKDNESCMIGYRLRNTLSPHGHVSRGICQTNEESYLAHITEHTHIKTQTNGNDIVSIHNEKINSLPTDAICSMNFWGFPASFIQEIETYFIQFLKEYGSEINSEWYIPTLIAELIKKERTAVKVLSCESNWFGVTYSEDKPHVMQALLKQHKCGDYPTSLRC
ncbi:MAG: nucleotidyltransferase [Kiritimatiellaceae bacterium]|nr:nucleotidyltransferase [Kiritimatiellaceae bacterium]|tara:strand:+ start:799 stop:1701 length:903 start_codon:yes stop_codon:yes gene_type:complete